MANVNAHMYRESQRSARRGWQRRSLEGFRTNRSYSFRQQIRNPFQHCLTSRLPRVKTSIWKPSSKNSSEVDSLSFSCRCGGISVYSKRTPDNNSLTHVLLVLRCETCDKSQHGHEAVAQMAASPHVNHQSPRIH